MPIVAVVLSIAKVTGATYRILATCIMGYYLVKSVREYERTPKTYRENPHGREVSRNGRKAGRGRS